MGASQVVRQSLLFSATCTSIALASPALAQRAAENALRSAEDAFGSSIGNESIGLYNPDNVRGFSPFAAGNVRLEGLYLDAVTGFNTRLVRGSSVRVGISAQGYTFIAPTGVADYRLRLPGDEAALSAVASVETLGTVRAELDGQVPLIADRLSLGLGVNASRDNPIYGGTANHAAAAAILRWRPLEGLEVVPFWSGLIHRSEDTQPRIFVAGDFLPKRIARGRYMVQPWALSDAEDVNYGTILRYTRDGWSLSAGAFRSFFNSRQSFSDQFLDTAPDGIAARHRVVATPDQKFASTSGEVRAARPFSDGPRRHILQATLRGRDQRRRYGGSSAAELGPADIGDVPIASEPAFTFGPQSIDRVRQLSYGIGYEGRWTEVGELTLGLQKTDYRKTSDIPGRSEAPTDAAPWLYNAGAAILLSDAIALYGGISRGLEESPVAPDVAVNRDEAPPAILTRQYDGGLRWTIAPGTRLVAGVFNLEKPYFSLDAENFYRRLGQVRHRGAEVSLTGAITPDLNIVAGAVLLDAEVSGEAVAGGLIGRRPVASTNRTILLSAEYRPPQLPGLSFDAGINSFGRRIANVTNSLVVPPAEFVNMGVRYQREIAGTPMTFRLQVNNLFDVYVWEVRASNAFYFNAPRNVLFRVTADL
jgi:iron complex outermembrane receptor protein